MPTASCRQHAMSGWHVKISNLIRETKEVRHAVHAQPSELLCKLICRPVQTRRFARAPSSRNLTTWQGSEPIDCQGSKAEPDQKRA